MTFGCLRCLPGTVLLPMNLIRGARSACAAAWRRTRVANMVSDVCVWGEDEERISRRRELRFGVEVGRRGFCVWRELPGTASFVEKPPAKHGGSCESVVRKKEAVVVENRQDA